MNEWSCHGQTQTRAAVYNKTTPPLLSLTSKAYLFNEHNSLVSAPWMDGWVIIFGFMQPPLSWMGYMNTLRKSMCNGSLLKVLDKLTIVLIYLKVNLGKFQPALCQNSVGSACKWIMLNFLYPELIAHLLSKNKQQHFFFASSGTAVGIAECTKNSNKVEKEGRQATQIKQ